MATPWKTIIPPRSVHDAHGLKERRLSTGFCHLRIGFSADPLKDDAWAKAHALTYGGFDAARWRREQGIDYHAYAGQRIWPMLAQKEHDARIDISENTLFRVIDQGIRHPTVCLWIAVNAQGDRHVYREYYATNRSIAMNCRTILSLTPEEEHISGNYIDPETKKRNPETLKTAIGVYAENGFYCTPADNSFVGYDSVTSAALSTLARNALRSHKLSPYLAELNPIESELLKMAELPALTFDLRFTNRCFMECCNLRWQESKGDETQKAPSEKPVDREDDGPDCVRYGVQSGLYYTAKPSRAIKIVDVRKIMQLKEVKRDRSKLWKRHEQRARYARHHG